MITQEEKQRREEIINFSRGNVRHEGVILSEEIELINQQFINGLINKSEHSIQCIIQMKKECLTEYSKNTVSVHSNKIQRELSH